MPPRNLALSNLESGEEITKNLTSAKWCLWHGNVKKALNALEECYLIVIMMKFTITIRKKC